jgi:DNA-binding MarR family transcriptional regulator
VNNRSFFPPPHSLKSEADEVWASLAILALRDLHSQYAEAFEQLGLSPPEARLLYFLRSDEPQSQRELAAKMGCSPSYVTGLVDRLEAQGIVERRVDARDRRANTVKLTPRGQTVQAELAGRLHTAPPAIASLSAPELALLRDVLRRLLDSGTAPPAA